jgi:hypothetical protein
LIIQWDANIASGEDFSMIFVFRITFGGADIRSIFEDLSKTTNGNFFGHIHPSGTLYAMSEAARSGESLE